jgi:hypothetical protein
MSDTQAGYDAMAEDYAAHFLDELATKPLDRAPQHAGTPQGTVRRIRGARTRLGLTRSRSPTPTRTGSGAHTGRSRRG